MYCTHSQRFHLPKYHCLIIEFQERISGLLFVCTVNYCYFFYIRNQYISRQNTEMTNMPSSIITEDKCQNAVSLSLWQVYKYTVQHVRWQIEPNLNNLHQYMISMLYAHVGTYNNKTLLTIDSFEWKQRHTLLIRSLFQLPSSTCSTILQIQNCNYTHCKLLESVFWDRFWKNPHYGSYSMYASNEICIIQHLKNSQLPVDRTMMNKWR